MKGPIEGGDQINVAEENEDENPTESAQPTDEVLISNEEAENEGSEVDKELSSEPGGGDDNPDDVSPTLDGEGKAHSSGYNLRKRKPINYGETRNYKTTATILYQHGEV